MPELARWLLGISSETERSATMQELFGRSGARMITVLEQLAKGNDSVVQAAKDQSAVISGEPPTTASKCRPVGVGPSWNTSSNDSPQMTMGSGAALMVFSVNGFGVAIVSSLGSDDTRETTKSS